MLIHVKVGTVYKFLGLLLDDRALHLLIFQLSLPFWLAVDKNPGSIPITLTVTLVLCLLMAIFSSSTWSLHMHHLFDGRPYPNWSCSVLRRSLSYIKAMFPMLLKINFILLLPLQSCSSCCFFRIFTYFAGLNSFLSL